MARRPLLKVPERAAVGDSRHGVTGEVRKSVMSSDVWLLTIQRCPKHIMKVGSQLIERWNA